MNATQPLISMVLPVYNVEKYLEKCLESVINQTYSNLEIILVNDGSTDSSLEICNAFQQKDSRIKIFTKENGGLSDARNYGLTKVTAKYVTFVDSDDSITEDYVEYLYYLLDKYRTKMSICSIFTHFQTNGKLIDNGNGTEGLLAANKAIEMMCYHDLVDTCAYAKLYSIELFDSIQFPKGKLFEDIGTIYKLFDKSKDIAFGFNAKYYYEIRPNSIVTSRFSHKKFDLLDMTDRMKSFVDEKYPGIEQATLRRAVYARFSTLNQMLNITEFEDERNEIIDYIVSNYDLVMKDAKTPKRDKAALFILKNLGFGFYKKIWDTYFYLQRGI
ncbi:glycosyltransferase family 2 protein [Streptococcus sp. NLN76]|uniref:glycosyltransferase family 2 protein n=1 Tax=Streptococcus sp. NLN76 TaxID=2822800 RepID=UPI0018AC174A|nr:glycosyltransferase family 2 protein [Streptococcus sp. NLN76]MBF8969895.1 glycosyltransferase family 2 protein [Streptococcus sp. NLN76]